MLFLLYHLRKLVTNLCSVKSFFSDSWYTLLNSKSFDDMLITGIIHDNTDHNQGRVGVIIDLLWVAWEVEISINLMTWSFVVN